MIRLDGKAVLVTGAGQGLGRAYAIACAEAGASVVVNDVDAGGADAVAAEITAVGGTATSAAGSVSSWSDTQRMMEVCTTTFGAIDGLVANAAIMHMASPWDEDEARLRAIVDVNIIGVQFVAARAMRAMVDSGRGGSVVTIVSGAQFGIIGMSAYGATKGAVTAMTANWSLEGAAHGIRVNAVSPFARTPMSLVHSSDRVGRGEIDEPPRLGNPEDVAPIVVSLLSESTQHITGRTFRFDGQQLSSYATSVESIAQQSSWTAEDITAALTSQAVSAASAD